MKKVLSLTLVLCMLVVGVPQLSVLAADNGPGQYRVSVSTALSLRSGPGTDYERLMLVPDNAMLSVTETSDGWGKTVYDGTEGWISLDYAIYYSDNAGNVVTSDQRSDIVRIAQDEVGYKEGKNNYTKYGVWYSSFTKNAPWCAIFVSWCAYQAGISESIIPKFSYCITGIQLFKNLGVWHEVSDYVPQKGDIIFFRGPNATTASDHVGIVVSCDGTKVYTIEGNSSDAVSQRTYDLTDTYIIGYASPSYVPAPTTVTTTTTTISSSSDATTASGTTAQTTAVSGTSATTSAAATSTAASTTSSAATASSTTASTTTATTASTSQPDSSEKTVLTVTGSVVNVRSDAGTDNAKIAAVRRGTAFESLGVKKDSGGVEWYNISVNGKNGYIISTYVTASTEQVPSQDNDNTDASGFIIVTGSTVNIRSGAGTGYSKLGKVNKNHMLTMTGSTTVDGVKWYMVEYNGSTGYISGDYSKLIEKIRVTGTVVNVRADAGTQHTRVGSVRRGQTYDLTGIKTASNGAVWYKVQWNGQDVYICSTYAQIV